MSFEHICVWSDSSLCHNAPELAPGMGMHPSLCRAVSIRTKGSSRGTVGDSRETERLPPKRMNNVHKGGTSPSRCSHGIDVRFRRAFESPSADGGRRRDKGKLVKEIHLVCYVHYNCSGLCLWTYSRCSTGVKELHLGKRD